MAGVELSRHVTFDLVPCSRKPMVVGDSFPPTGGGAALVKQHGFNVQPGAAAAYVAQAQARFAAPSVTESESIDESIKVFASASVGFKVPGVKGLLDLSNASSGTPGACSLSSSYYETAPSSHVEVTATAHVTPGVQRLVKAVQRGLRACQEPEAAEQGLGGTYFFMNEAGRKVAIMKPCDEEPLAPNNPKGFVGRNLGDLGLKPTVRVGEAAMREVAAYLLDHDHWARVPHSCLVRMAHPVFHVSATTIGETVSSSSLRRAGSSCTSLMDPTTSSGLDSMQSVTFADGAPAAVVGSPADGVPCKLGSLQEFVAHDCDTSEMGPSRFSVRDVHRIGVLDIRLLNTDRHAGNLLVRRPRPGSSANLGSGLARLDERQMELIPIDHGFCLPEALEPPYFEWLYWPQAMIPFDEEELDYISKLDPAKDIQLLQDNLPNLPEGCHRTLEVATTLLKKGAAAGLSLFEIGSVLSRPLVGLDEDPSELERACAAARAELEERRAAGSDADSEEGAESGDEVYDSDSSAEEDVAGPLGAGLRQGLMDDALLRATTGSTASAVTTAAGLDADQLLFCFEDERGASSPARASPCKHHHQLPGSRSCIVLPSSPDGAASDGRRTSLDGPLESPFATLAASGGLRGHGGERNIVVGGMAKSLCPPTAFNSAQHVARRARRRSHSHAAPKGHRKASKYPPPVRAASPDATSALFEGLEDQDDWRLFMTLLGKELDDALAAGVWRASGGGQQQQLGMSCPKF